MNNKRLINQLKKHNEKALEEIIDEYSSYVYTIANNILGQAMSKEDVEEVVSDSFLCLWNVAETLDNDKPLSPFLAAITRNISKNRLRKLSNNISIDDITEFSSFETPEDEFEISEQTRLMLDIVDNLCETDREIFIRFYYYGEKLQAISSHLNITLSSCKTKLCRVREKIKKELTERGYKNAK